MVLADLERRRGRKVDVEKLLRMALLHDAEESTTGDIHHPFKHQDPAFTKTIDDRALQWFGNLMLSLPDTLARDYIELRKAEQQDSTEAVLVKAADKLEALLWAYEEYLLGNEQVRNARIIEDILSKLDRIRLPSVKAVVAETRRKMNAHNHTYLNE
jgi:5'-deoxynucleotidase YfbR-like HD superfamily hydrolase